MRNIFLNVTNISYSVSSAFSTVTTNNIHTLVNGVDISSTATFTGNNTNWNVSVPCPQNQLITLVINATDANRSVQQYHRRPLTPSARIIL